MKTYKICTKQVVYREYVFNTEQDLEKLGLTEFSHKHTPPTIEDYMIEEITSLEEVKK